MAREKKIQLHSTLDRPYTIISGKDPVCDTISEQGRMIEAYELPFNVNDVDQKLDFDGNVVHIYDDDTVYSFEVPQSLQIVPEFMLGELLSIVGPHGHVWCNTLVVSVTPDLVSTSCGRKWTVDGKIVSAHGAHSDLQICRYF